MKLEIGVVAPPFEVDDIFGGHIDLRAYKGKSVLLSFLRNGGCAMCNLRVHQLIMRYPEFHARGLEMLAVFESPVTSIKQYVVSKQDVPFPIIADPSAALYDLYGVEVSQEKTQASVARVDTPEMQQRIQAAASIGYQLMHEEGANFNRIPADFLIGPDQHIQLAFYSDFIGEHLSFAEIEGALSIHK
ncbi:alkyl hydroperoxide reductase [Dictyobacter alpinus]|uniref:Alkyl hydroperoxide reductase n=1 Tax=Dictyobacter alpinus TaxID=2014873 RepID=A0A402BCM2_9CHLR|nr:redoxin domain-containing protein [Dictyobacter alpinus]GCE29148.1 alkyl hydroperoxide reductase [Dictyobacter alpinus]